jgi:hypothetical protein
MASSTASVVRLGRPQSLPTPTMALTAASAMNGVLLARLRADSGVDPLAYVKHVYI